MGVQGLLSFLRRRFRASHRIDIFEFIKSTGRHRVLVDAIGVWGTWIECSNRSVAIPNFEDMHHQLIALIRLFFEAGAQLVFYVDSTSLDQTKQAESLKRTNDKINDITIYNDWVEGFVSELSLDDSSNLPGLPMYTWELVSTIRSLTLSDLMMPPHSSTESASPLSNKQQASALSKLLPSVIICNGEADEELARDASTDPHCIGVLGADSDFFVTRGVAFLPFETACFLGAPLLPGFLPMDFNSTATDIESDSESDLEPAADGIDVDGAGTEEKLNVETDEDEESKSHKLPSQRASITFSKLEGYFSGEHSTASSAGLSIMRFENSFAAEALKLPTNEQQADFSFLAGNDYTKSLVSALDLLCVSDGDSQAAVARTFVLASENIHSVYLSDNALLEVLTKSSHATVFPSSSSPANESDVFSEVDSGESLMNKEFGFGRLGQQRVTNVAKWLRQQSSTSESISNSSAFSSSCASDTTSSSSMVLFALLKLQRLCHRYISHDEQPGNSLAIVNWMFDRLFQALSKTYKSYLVPLPEFLTRFAPKQPNMDAVELKSKLRNSRDTPFNFSAPLMPQLFDRLQQKSLAIMLTGRFSSSVCIERLSQRASHGSQLVTPLICAHAALVMSPLQFTSSTSSSNDSRDFVLKIWSMSGVNYAPHIVPLAEFPSFDSTVCTMSRSVSGNIANQFPLMLVEPSQYQQQLLDATTTADAAQLSDFPFGFPLIALSPHWSPATIASLLLFPLFSCSSIRRAPTISSPTSHASSSNKSSSSNVAEFLPSTSSQWAGTIFPPHLPLLLRAPLLTLASWIAARHHQRPRTAAHVADVAALSMMMATMHALHQIMMPQWKKQSASTAAAASTLSCSASSSASTSSSASPASMSSFNLDAITTLTQFQLMFCEFRSLASLFHLQKSSDESQGSFSSSSKSLSSILSFGMKPHQIVNGELFLRFREICLNLHEQTHSSDSSQHAKSASASPSTLSFSSSSRGVFKLVDKCFKSFQNDDSESSFNALVKSALAASSISELSASWSTRTLDSSLISIAQGFTVAMINILEQKLFVDLGLMLVQPSSSMSTNQAQLSSSKNAISALPSSSSSYIASSSSSSSSAALPSVSTASTLPSFLSPSYASLARLPADEFAQQIADTVARDSVIVIQGETGSGKSSRVPRIIYDHWYHQQSSKGTVGLNKQHKQSQPKHPFIIITQPRRIAAISLARRVAAELNEEVGQTVGYRIGQVSQFEFGKTRICFVTSGWLLQKLVTEPTYLLQCSHLLIDEVHERGVDADILYVVIRRLMRHLDGLIERGEVEANFIKPKLVLMSATFNTDLFASYFAPVSKQDSQQTQSTSSIRKSLLKAPASSSSPSSTLTSPPSYSQPIFVGVHRYPVSIFHLDELVEYQPLSPHQAPLYRCPMSESTLLKLGQEIMRLSLPPSFQSASGTSPSHVDVASGVVGVRSSTFVEENLTNLMIWLCLNLTAKHSQQKDEGNCILVFLPGLLEIENAYAAFDEALLLRESSSSSSSFSPSKPKSYSSKVSVEKEKLSTLPLNVVMLHSLVDDPMFIFEPIAPGHTRIILSTNISESSVTIPNVRYIIDFGTHKQVEYSTKYHCPMLIKTCVSQASARQRSGRAGRLMPGTVFRFYTKEMHDKLSPYDTPEIRRVSLASVILRLKMSSQDESVLSLDAHTTAEGTSAVDKLQHFGAGDKSSETARNGKQVMGPHDDEDEVHVLEEELSAALQNQKHKRKQAKDIQFTNVLNDPEKVLADTLEPPSVKSVRSAFRDLVDVGALVKSSTTTSSSSSSSSSPPSSLPGASEFTRASLTSLGQFIAHLPFSLELSLALAYAVAVDARLLPHMVIIASALSQQEVFLLPMSRVVSDPAKFVSMTAHSTFGRLKSDKGRLSEMLGSIEIFKDYASLLQQISSHHFLQKQNSAHNSSSSQQGNFRKQESKLISSARTPLLFESLDDRFHSHDPVMTWYHTHGISMDRMKTLLNTVAEISLRLTACVPQHSQLLQSLASLARGSRALRSKAMSQAASATSSSDPESSSTSASASLSTSTSAHASSKPDSSRSINQSIDILDVDLEALLPMDDDSISLLHLMLISSLHRNVITGTISHPATPVQVPEKSNSTSSVSTSSSSVPMNQWPAEQTTMMPSIPEPYRNELLFNVPELSYFRSCVDRVFAEPLLSLQAAKKKSKSNGNNGQNNQEEIDLDHVMDADGVSDGSNLPSMMTSGQFITAPLFIRFAALDMVSPIIVHSSGSLSESSSSEHLNSSSSRFVFSRSSASSSSATTLSSSLLTTSLASQQQQLQLWSTFQASSSAHQLLSTPGNRLVSLRPFASIVLQRLFLGNNGTWSLTHPSKLPAAFWTRTKSNAYRPVGMSTDTTLQFQLQPQSAPGSIVSPQLLEVKGCRGTATVGWKMFEQQGSKASGVSMPQQSIITSLMTQLVEEGQNQNAKLGNDKKSRQKQKNQLKVTFAQNVIFHAVVANFMRSESGSARADRVSLLPFATAQDRLRSSMMLMLAHPGQLVKSSSNSGCVSLKLLDSHEFEKLSLELSSRSSLSQTVTFPSAGGKPNVFDPTSLINSASMSGNQPAVRVSMEIEPVLRRARELLHGMLMRDFTRFESNDLLRKCLLRLMSLQSVSLEDLNQVESLMKPVEQLGQQQFPLTKKKHQEQSSSTQYSSRKSSSSSSSSSKSPGSFQAPTILAPSSTSTSTSSLTCPSCPMRFQTLDRLQAHIKKFGSHGAVCAVCDERFFNDSFLQAHFSIVHQSTNGSKLKTNGFAKSSSTVASSTQASSSLSSSASSSVVAAVVSSKASSQAISRTLECPQCPKKFINQCDLDSHNSKLGKHGAICTVCNLKLSGPKDLKNHTNSRHKPTTTSLSQSISNVKNSSELQMNSVLSSSTSAVSSSSSKCSICSFVADSMMDLVTHNFDVHLSMNSRSSSNIISQSSFKSFNSVQEQQFQLDQQQLLSLMSAACSSSVVTSSSSLALSSTTQSLPHSSVLFDCAQCLLSFSSERKLTKHIKSAGPDHGAVCVLCEQRLMNKSQLEVHMKKKHSS